MSSSVFFFFETVSSQVAMKLPSIVITLIVVFPSLIALMIPVSDIVATFSFKLSHFTCFCVASFGSIVATKLPLSPTSKFKVFLFSVTPVTSTFVTSISQFAVWLPSLVVTVIVAFPAFFPVTTPFSTVAIVSSELFHVIFLFVAFSGNILAFNVTVSDSFICCCVFSN